MRRTLHVRPGYAAPGIPARAHRFGNGKSGQRLHQHRPAHPFAKLGVETYDFTELASAGSSNCEYCDGFLGGEVTYARILTAIPARNTNAALAGARRHSRVQALIREYADLAVLNEPAQLYKLGETGFLNQGCLKNRRVRPAP